MPASLPTVSLVILNLNGRSHLETLLPTVEALDYPARRLQVLVTDNGSEDGSVEYVRQSHQRFEAVALDRNHGFAEGNNRGAARARGEWVGFINNDMRLERSWLRDMLTTLRAHPDAASIGSKIVNWDGSAIDFVGSRLNFQGHAMQLDYGASVSEHDHERRILAPCGGAMLIRKDVFELLGGWDPDFFGFFEDVDLGWRLNLLGHDAWYNPRAVVYHRLHGTYEKMRSHRLRVLYERNALFAIYKCLDDRNLAVALPAALYALNERALIIAGLDRSEFDINARPAPAQAPAGAGSGSLPRKGLGSLRRDGLGGTARRTAAYAGRRLAKLGETAPPPPDDTVRVPRVAMAHYLAVSEFVHALERMTDKRRWLQANRRRSDAEIFEMNGDVIEPVHEEAGYPEFHRWLVGVLDLRSKLGAGLAAGRPA